MASVKSSPFSGYQKFVIALLAFLQFTIILDFMILSPLGATLIPALKITPSQFSLVVSVYAFAAGISGLMAAGFADRFDRRKFLLFFYVGFVAATLLCGLARDYHTLLIARMVTGLFGGVIGSIVFAITTDLFAMEVRGRVMGVVQTAFAASQVLGLPLGIYLCNLWGWHAPFQMIAGAGVLGGVLIFFRLKPITGHLLLKPDRSPVHHLIQTLTRPRYVQGFATMALLSVGGFMLMPFGSAFAVGNLGLTLDMLPKLYLISGAFSIVVGPLVGRMADRVGKFQVFAAGTTLFSLTVLYYTRLSVTPFAIVAATNILIFTGISARMISSSALISGVPQPADRGAFMAVGASLQQISGGIAAVVAGMIVAQHGEGPLENYARLGDVVVVAGIFTVVMMYFINRYVRGVAPATSSLQTEAAH